MRLRLTQINDYRFLMCVKYQFYGSYARFSDWKVGDYLAFQIGKDLAGLARITGESYRSKECIWEGKYHLHSNRIAIEFVHVPLPENRLPLPGEIIEALISAWGKKYESNILHEAILPEAQSKKIVDVFRTGRNDLDAVKNNLRSLMIEAGDRDTDLRIRLASKLGDMAEAVLRREPPFDGLPLHPEAYYHYKASIPYQNAMDPELRRRILESEEEVAMAVNKGMDLVDALLPHFIEYVRRLLR